MFLTRGDIIKALLLSFGGRIQNGDVFFFVLANGDDTAVWCVFV